MFGAMAPLQINLQQSLAAAGNSLFGGLTPAAIQRLGYGPSSVFTGALAVLGVRL